MIRHKNTASSQRVSITLTLADRMTHMSQRLTLTARRSARLSGEPCQRRERGAKVKVKVRLIRGVPLNIFIYGMIIKTACIFFQTYSLKMEGLGGPGYFQLGTHIENGELGQVLEVLPVSPHVVDRADDHHVFELVVVKIRGTQRHHQVTQTCTGNGERLITNGAEGERLPTKNNNNKNKYYSCSSSNFKPIITIPPRVTCCSARVPNKV